MVVAIETLDLNDNAPELDRQYTTAMCDSASVGQVSAGPPGVEAAFGASSCRFWTDMMLPLGKSFIVPAPDLLVSFGGVGKESEKAPCWPSEVETHL